MISTSAFVAGCGSLDGIRNGSRAVIRPRSTRSGEWSDTGTSLRRRKRLTKDSAVVRMNVAPTVPRIGHGFDLHRLEPGPKLILGGVTLDHDRGCVGHSDGDVVYHCVVDAVLGAMSLPDIGQIFPDKDPKWKGASSDIFMRATKDLMDEAGYQIGNIDVTVILERPKMSPHKDKMRANIADLLGCELATVNLKAKTHEKVDALGENRAVACHTVALLLPKAETSLVASPASSAAATSANVTVPPAVDALFSSAFNRAELIMKDVDFPDTATAVVATAASDGSSSSSNASQSQPHALSTLYDTVLSRRGADPQSSWTAKLFSKGREKIAQKVGEEGVETVIAGVANDPDAVIKESADLLYHLSVLWADMDVAPEDVWQELRRREGTSGIAERNARSKS